MGKDKENEFVDVKDVEKTEGAMVPGVTVQTADPIAYGAGIESLGYDDWAAINVKDTTKEYQNAQAALDLNYKTEKATYGENAERMYQMGLSGSGVSDIYGANAYSAYLAASNDLKLRQIEEQKANRQSWEKYRREQEDKSRLQHATAFSTFSDQYSEGANGVNNENALRASMAAQGMSQAEVDAVMKDIKSYWAGNASVRDANHKAVIDAGYATAYGLFDGTNAEEVKQALIANEFSEADADEVMQKFYETDEKGNPVRDENGNPKLKDTSALPMVKEKGEMLGRAQNYIMQNYNGKNLEQLYANLLNDNSGITQADIEKLRTWFKEQNNTDSWGGMVKAKEEQDAADQNAANKIYNAYKDSFVWSGNEAAEGEDEEKAVADLRAELERQNYSGAAIDMAIENLKNNFTANYNAATIAQNLMSDPEYKYTGTASDKGEIKRSIKALGYSDAQADDIMGEMDKIYQTRNEERISDVTSDSANISLAKLQDLMGSATPDQKAKLTLKAERLLSSVLDDESGVGLANAYNLIGVDSTLWGSMSEGERMLAVLDTVGQYSKNGLVTKSKARLIFNEFIKDQLDLTSEPSELQNLLLLVNNYLDKGYINESLAEDLNADIEKKIEKIKVAIELAKGAKAVHTVKKIGGKPLEIIGEKIGNLFGIGN